MGVHRILQTTDDAPKCAKNKFRKYVSSLRYAVYQKNTLLKNQKCVRHKNLYFTVHKSQHRGCPIGGIPTLYS